jgi:methyltransferase (TIGR00027 family)
MPKAIENTGMGTIAGVAIEQFFPREQRLIQDDLAYQVLPWAVRAFVCLLKWKPLRDWLIRVSERDMPGIWVAIMGRKHYIDDSLEAAAGEIEAVVNLGAGFDTRAYRLPALKNIPVWEVDFPGNIKAKKRELCRIFGQVPANVKLVPLDFDKERLDEVLQEHGFSLARKSFFILEGVTQYLTPEGMGTTFAYLAKTASGSKLVFTYVLKDFIEGKEIYGLQKGYDKYVLKDKMWIFGKNKEEWPAYLQQYSWQITEDLGSEYFAEKYVRPTGRKFALLAIERTILAEKI